MTRSGEPQPPGRGTLPVRLVPDRLIGIVGAAMFALGAISLGTMATAPCNGDFMCPVQGLVFFGPPVLAYLAALVVWLAKRRIMPLLVLSVFAGLFGLGLLSTGYVVSLVTPMLGYPFLAPVVVIGSIEVLRGRRIERWLSVVALGALAVTALVAGSPSSALITAVIAVGIAVLSGPRTDRSNDQAGDQAGDVAGDRAGLRG